MVFRIQAQLSTYFEKMAWDNKSSDFKKKNDPKQLPLLSQKSMFYVIVVSRTFSIVNQV